jgi:hypothetical protein
MADYITLLGAEQVQTAANTMRGAAEEMMRAASENSYVAERQRQFMDDWLLRFEGAIEKLTTIAEKPAP